MKRILRTLTVILIMTASSKLHAQCGAGYTLSQLNWDRLDYYFNSGSNVQPYGHGSGNYITNAQEMTQRFAIGRNYVTIVTPAAGIVDGENASHTGDVATAYAGEDAQFTPTTNGQQITLTFNAEVQNVQFTLYDVDASQRIDIDAFNAASTGQNVNVVTYSGSLITISNNNTTNAHITSNGTNAANNVNTASATITISGTVKTIRFTITTLGTDPVLWLSDINACVNNGTFPTNYQQTTDNRPLQGAVMNQPDYFIVTPDNNSAYMVDPATGNAWMLFTDASKTYINSFAYDPRNHYLYYISENATVDGTNRTLKRYDFNTETSSVLVADITATLGIPTLGSGVESAGAAFYDGALYLGIEGGKFDASGTTNDRTRETMIWRIDFDASQNPTVAYQVWATDAYLNASNTSIHDFGDFVIKNGVLYDFNTARNSTNYSQSKYMQFNMTTGAMTSYNNPGSAAWNGQASIGWNGTLYYMRNGTGTVSEIGTYNEAGVNGTPVSITVVDGTGAWPGGNGDASENFRPKVDFGDAPSTYDPNTLSPAAHAQDANLRLGANFDKEWKTKGQTALANSDTYDDGLPFISTFNPNAASYLTEVTVFNNTGVQARVCAWLDYNGNNVFDAAEGITVTVNSSATPQPVYLYWPSISSSLSMGSFTYLRIRVTRTTDGMTTSHPTGYFGTGEVEDYRIPVNSFALDVQLNNFDAKLTPLKTVKLNWSVSDESDVAGYQIERSRNSINWEPVKGTAVRMANGAVSYEDTDPQAMAGTSYYRLKIIGRDGKTTLSPIKKIDNNIDRFSIQLAPNPAVDKAVLYVKSASTAVTTGKLEMINAQGLLVHQQNLRVANGTNAFELTGVAKLAPGYYIVRVITDREIYSESLIISKSP